MTTSTKRPISVLIVAGLYLAVGLVGFVAHFPRVQSVHREDAVIELTELVALTAGIYLLRGQNWARWVALAWIAGHVGISFLNGLVPVAIHSVFAILIAWALFQPAANRYFGGAEA